MNIRLRLTLWYAAILFLILAVFSLAVYIGLTRSLLLTTDNHLQREVGELLGNMKVEQSGHGDDEHELETDIELKYTPEEGVYWRILDPAGGPIIDPGHFSGITFDPTALQAGQTRFEYGQLANHTPLRIYTAPFVLEGQGAGIIQVAESYLHIQEVQGQLVLLLALGIPFTLLAASAGGWFLAAGALNPIDRITRAAGEISAQDLHRRLNLKLPNDEVGRLAATFDTMLARLEDAFERQKRFIADASHEMRTPLTILKGDVEVALNRPRTTQEYRQTLEMVNQTADRLNQLVEELLLLARTDNRQVPLKVEPVDLTELLSTVVGRLLPRAVSKDIALNLNTPDGVTLQADAAKLTRLFTNLVDNAIKYSEAGDTVTVTVTPRLDYAAITVADTGPGIAAEHMAQLFERFYRADKARSRAMVDGNGGGAGLGLSIAQWLAQVHGGQITVASRPGHGATFTVRLPLNQPNKGNNSP
jgi:heavy metal sensor kinase